MGAGEAKLSYAAIECRNHPKTFVNFALLAEDGTFKTLEFELAPPANNTPEAIACAEDKFLEGVADVMFPIVRAECGVEIITTDEGGLVYRYLNHNGYIAAAEQPNVCAYTMYLNPTKEVARFTPNLSTLVGNSAATMLAKHLAVKTKVD